MKCDIGFIDDDNHVVVESDQEARQLLNSNIDFGCINIHIVNSIPAGSLGVYYPNSGNEGIFLSRRTYADANLRSTISHEVGHYLYLDHTHQYYDKGKCKKEAIDRDRTWPFFNFCISKKLISRKICETTGDALSDTPADPELNNNNSCTFNTFGFYNTFLDLWGDSYVSPPQGSSVPSTSNIMSYNGLRNCRSLFSKLQIAVMLNTLIAGKNSGNYSYWNNNNATYDDYEMDNFSNVARNISIGEIQEHSFHQQYDGSGQWSQCDVDWVRFIAPCTQNMNVTTSALYNLANANTRLTLFNNDATIQLAQNDNISANNLFSNINFNFIAGQEYLIRVDNMQQNNTTTYYQLSINATNSISGEIFGNNYPCLNIPTTYQLSQPVPAGTNVFWSIEPNDGTIQIQPNGNTAEVTSTNPTYDVAYTIKATSTTNCQTTVRTKNFTIPSITYSGYIIGSNGSGNTVYSNALVAGDNYFYLYGNANFYEIEITDVMGSAISGAYWEYVSGDMAISSGNHWLHFSASYYTAVDAYYNFHYSDDCGTKIISFHFMTLYSAPPEYRMMSLADSYNLSLTPNPANNFAKLTVIEKSLNQNKKVKSKLFDFTTSKIIQVYNQFGVLVQQEQAIIPKSGYMLNVSILNSGAVYMVVIKDSGGNILSAKLLK